MAREWQRDGAYAWAEALRFQIGPDKPQAHHFLALDLKHGKPAA